MHDDAFFKVVYIPLASSWTSFHRSTARWRYLVNRQSTTDGALWYLNGSSWTSCLIKLDLFISQNHRCRRFGVNELHFAHLSYLLGNYSLSYYSYRVFFSLRAPSLIQFDLLTQTSSVLVLEMRWRLIRFGYSWSLNSNQCILFIISLAVCSRWELACVAFPSPDRPQQKQALGKCVGQIEKACSSTPERRCVAFCTSNNIKHQGFIYHPTERRTAKEEICGIRPSAEKIYMVNCGILPVHTCPPVA